MYGEGLHPDCLINSQYYPGSNPLDEVWRLDSRRLDDFAIRDRSWAVGECAGGEKAKNSNHTGWKLDPTRPDQYTHAHSPAAAPLLLFGERPDPLPYGTEGCAHLEHQIQLELGFSLLSSE
jgi:hypothetical protein